MSRETTNLLLENSLAASLSAIEIYNKPNFPYRNEVFCILIVNAWELLLKAKIMNDNDHQISSIHVFDNKGIQKLNRNNAPLTIEIYGAMDVLDISETIKKNLSSLIDIRDTSIHYISSNPIDYLVYSLGAACLRNYQKCIKDWFGRDLLEYNFYIMPLGFSNSFKAFKMLDLDKEPDEIKRLINMISDNQQSAKNEDGFTFTCEIQINMVSAKKITDNTDLHVSINPDATDYVIVERLQKITDRYPLSFLELWNKIHKAIPTLKQTDFIQFLKKNKIKDNDKLSAYNWRYKWHEDEYKKAGRDKHGTASLYNEDCYNYLLLELNKKKEEKVKPS